jgi:hypothetical protein
MMLVSVHQFAAMQREARRRGGRGNGGRWQLNCREQVWIALFRCAASLLRCELQLSRKTQLIMPSSMRTAWSVVQHSSALYEHKLSRI